MPFISVICPANFGPFWPGSMGWVPASVPSVIHSCSSLEYLMNRTLLPYAVNPTHGQMFGSLPLTTWVPAGVPSVSQSCRPPFVSNSKMSPLPKGCIAQFGLPVVDSAVNWIVPAVVPSVTQSW